MSLHGRGRGGHQLEMRGKEKDLAVLIAGSLQDNEMSP